MQLAGGRAASSVYLIIAILFFFLPEPAHVQNGNPARRTGPRPAKQTQGQICPKPHDERSRITDNQDPSGHIWGYAHRLCPQCECRRCAAVVVPGDGGHTRGVMNEANTANHRKNSVVIVLIGVSGSGKSTVGKLLARDLDCQFYEGDTYHSPANKRKMREGIPLTDADRWPWLNAIRKVISKELAQKKDAVVACSALAQSYRDHLRQPGVKFVYLKGDFDLFRERIEKRRGHFFDPDLLASQFEALEELVAPSPWTLPGHPPPSCANQERLGLNKRHEEPPAKDRDDDARLLARKGHAGKQRTKADDKKL